jgi:hypothetical protein
VATPPAIAEGAMAAGTKPLRAISLSPVAAPAAMIKGALIADSAPAPMEVAPWALSWPASPAQDKPPVTVIKVPKLSVNNASLCAFIQCSYLTNLMGLICFDKNYSNLKNGAKAKHYNSFFYCHSRRCWFCLGGLRSKKGIDKLMRMGRNIEMTGNRTTCLWRDVLVGGYLIPGKHWRGCLFGLKRIAASRPQNTETQPREAIWLSDWR